MPTNYTRDQVLNAMLLDYKQLCNEAGVDGYTDKEYLQSLSSLTYDELVSEIEDQDIDFNKFMEVI